MFLHNVVRKKENRHDPTGQSGFGVGRWSPRKESAETALHIVDHDLTKPRTAHLGGAVHQAGEVIGHLLTVD
jgi:hypothetical protein